MSSSTQKCKSGHKTVPRNHCIDMYGKATTTCACCVAVKRLQRYGHYKRKEKAAVIGEVFVTQALAEEGKHLQKWANCQRGCADNPADPISDAEFTERKAPDQALRSLHADRSSESKNRGESAAHVQTDERLWPIEVRSLTNGGIFPFNLPQSKSHLIQSESNLHRRVSRSHASLAESATEASKNAPRRGAQRYRCQREVLQRPSRQRTHIQLIALRFRTLLSQDCNCLSALGMLQRRQTMRPAACQEMSHKPLTTTVAMGVRVMHWLCPCR